MIRSARYSPARNRGGAGDRSRDDRAVAQLEIQRGPDQILRRLQQFGGQRHQLFLRQPAMTVVHGFAERVGDARPHPDHGGLVDAELDGDGVGGLEPDAANVPRKSVRVLGHDLHGVGAVGLEDAYRPGRSHTVAVQEHHDLAHHLLLRPGLGNALRTDRADAVHLPQAPGFHLDDIKHAFSECPDKLAGIHRADAPDAAGGEVFLHALAGRRRREAQEARLELLTVDAVVDPLPGRRDPFASGHHGGVAHHGDQIAVPARLGPQDAEAAVGAVEGDALDQAGQDLPVRILGARADM